MITQLFKKEKELSFERSYPAPVETVWEAWTDPEAVRQWWGPEKTSVAECEIDLRVGGRIHIVTVAGEEMGKYAGTRWPMDGEFTVVEENRRLAYEARSWTEGEEEGTTILHTNDLTLASDGETTTVSLHIRISEIGPKAKLAVMGMKWGYKSYFDELEKYLTARTG